LAAEIFLGTPESKHDLKSPLAALSLQAPPIYTPLVDTPLTAAVPVCLSGMTEPNNFAARHPSFVRRARGNEFRVLQRPDLFEVSSSKEMAGFVPPSQTPPVGLRGILGLRFQPC